MPRNGIVWVGMLVLVGSLAGCERVVERQIERQLDGRVNSPFLTSPDLNVVLCGTGSPLTDPDRAGACTAIVVDGRLYLVDVGPGSVEAALVANLPIAELGGIFLTHYHSDHIGDLGEALTQSWVAGRDAPLPVHGAEGVGEVVAGFNRAYAADVGYRVAHHGAEHLPPEAAPAVARETPLGAARDASAVVLEEQGLRVTMFAVEHPPIQPAVGYRFEWGGRSVVISGDTKYAENLVAHARGADLLIHEVLHPELIGRLEGVARRTGQTRLADLVEDTLDYHTSPLDTAKIAQAAGVPHLVFTHIVPPPLNVVVKRQFTAGLADVYEGTVTLGDDGDVFTFAAE